MDRVAILMQLAADVESGKKCFTPNVGVALKIRDALEDPDCHIEEAARLITAEPLLAARVVAMANSIGFNASGREITDIRTAVSRLGFRVIRGLAIALVTRQMAQMPVGPEEKKLAARLWEYTVHVAALARLIAREVTKQDQDTAMFAAIVHDVGGFYLLARSAEFPGLLEEGLSDDDVEGELALGRAVLKILNVPHSVVDGIEVFWQGFLALPPDSLGDTLLLAANLAPVERPLNRLAGRNRSEAVANIDMIVGEETLQKILHSSREEVESLLNVLNF